jgi:hypothetical protein
MEKKPVDLAPIKNLIRNEWNWSLLDFSEKLGIEPDRYAEEKFEAFRQASIALRQFDIRCLAILCGD